MDAARRLATYEDLLTMPEDVRAEILDGEVVVSPPPSPDHSKAHSSVNRLIGGPFDEDDGRGGPGGWWIFIELDIRLGRHQIVRPDLSGWRRERLPDPAAMRPIEIAPDWICEIISPSNEANDRVTKRRLYAESGVGFYWMVNPEARTLEALRLRDGTWHDVGAYDETDVARIAPFEAVELEVGRLFLPRKTEAAETTGSE